MYNTPGTKYHLALPIVPLRIGYYNEKAEPPRNVWLAQGKPYAERTWNCFRFLILLSLCASLGTLLACRHPSWACVSVPGRVMLALQCPWPHHAHHRPCPLGSHAPLVWVALRLPYWCPSPRVCPSPSLLPTQRPEGLSETWMGPQPSLVLNPAVSPGEGNGNPLQYSSLDSSMDRGAWWATVHGSPRDTTEGLILYTFFSLKI